MTTNPKDILPHKREPEPYQETGRRSGLLVLMCAQHTDNVWVLDPQVDEGIGTIGPQITEAMAHFVVERDPDDEGLCQPTAVVAWRFEMDPGYMSYYRAELKEAARKAAAKAAAVEDGGTDEGSESSEAE